PALARDRLEPRQLQDLRRDRAAQSSDSGHLLSSNRHPVLTPALLVRIARFRELLQEAATRTSIAEVIDRYVKSLASNQQPQEFPDLPDTTGLLQMLAAEWTLLSSPPLGNQDLTETVASIAADVAEQRDANTD